MDKNNSNLPKVSIITPTYNKKNFFKLAIHNFLSFEYPVDKLEWIILDDGDESIKDILPNDSRIKYYYYSKEIKEQIHKSFIESYKKKKEEYNKLSKKNKKGKKYKLLKDHKKSFKGNRLPIGMKRNICVQYATTDYIIHMDDDDYYPPNSILHRVNELLLQQKNNNSTDSIESFSCIGCSTIGAFHINKMISIMYTPSVEYSAAKKISVATLAYTKNFWNENHFENQDIINEGEYFLRKRKCYEINWKNVIVALFHSKNDQNIRMFNNLTESNGWHFGPLSDDLFTLIVNLDINANKDINENKDVKKLEELAQ